MVVFSNRLDYEPAGLKPFIEKSRLGQPQLMFSGVFGHGEHDGTKNNKI